MINYFSTKAYRIIESSESQELSFDVDLQAVSVVNDGDADVVITIYLNAHHKRETDPKEITFTVKSDESFEEVFYTTFSKISINASSDYRMILRL